MHAVEFSKTAAPRAGGDSAGCCAMFESLAGLRAFALRRWPRTLAAPASAHFCAERRWSVAHPGPGTQIQTAPAGLASPNRGAAM